MMVELVSGFKDGGFEVMKEPRYRIPIRKLARLGSHSQDHFTSQRFTSNYRELDTSHHGGINSDQICDPAFFYMLQDVDI